MDEKQEIVSEIVEKLEAQFEQIQKEIAKKCNGMKKDLTTVKTKRNKADIDSIDNQINKLTRYFSRKTSEFYKLAEDLKKNGGD